MSSPEKREEDPCCPMQLKTGVQIIAGVLAIISSVILVNENLMFRKTKLLPI
jgi:hypothetical protein